MIGDTNDMLRRLNAVLPLRWFSDAAPVIQALLTGLAVVWSGLYQILAFVRLQTRLATATGAFLDMAAQDFFGMRVVRAQNQSDAAFLAVIRREMLRDRATRPAMASMMIDLTGRTPNLFEPARPADTGAWNGPLGYGVTGAWGSLSMPFQFLITAYRPAPGSINMPVADADILAAVASVAPVASVAWTRISN